MKYTKKLVALTVVLILALALAAPSFAADIEIKNPVSGQTYNIYKIFDLKVNADGDSYSYTIPSDSPWLSTVQSFAADIDNGLTIQDIAGDPANKNVKVDKDKYTETVAANFAVTLNNALHREDNPVVDTPVATANTENSYNATGLDKGYYFIDSSMGALCALYSTDSTQEVREKNEKPGIDKVVTGATDDEGHEKSVNIGDTLTYTITVTAGGAADTDYVVHDRMSDGLTLNEDSFVIKVGDVVVPESNYSINPAPDTDESCPYFEDKDTKGNCTFEITFNQAYTATLEKNTEITITYTAVVNANADTGLTDPETNKAILEYGNTFDKTEDPTNIYTYEFDVVKTDGTGALLGDAEIGYAKFELYTEETGGNAIALYKVSDGVYRPAVTDEEKIAQTTELVAHNGQMRIYGLAADTYYLEETAAPNGYNILPERKEVNLNNGNASWSDADSDGIYDAGEGGIQVINETGALLPGTGGIGTTIFYTLGGLLVVGAAVLLVTKKRVHDMEA